MSMTLEELLALLPDNATGEISAADMRAIVTELYQAATSTGTSYPFKWTTTTPPAAGRVTMDQPWQLYASKLIVSETADDGTVLGFGLVDSAVAGEGWLTTAGGQYVAKITGPSVDRGDYREVPIAPKSMTGSPPSEGEPLTLSFVTVLAKAVAV